MDHRALFYCLSAFITLFDLYDFICFVLVANAFKVQGPTQYLLPSFFIVLDLIISAEYDRCFSRR